MVFERFFQNFIHKFSLLNMKSKSAVELGFNCVPFFFLLHLLPVDYCQWHARSTLRNHSHRTKIIGAFNTYDQQSTNSRIRSLLVVFFSFRWPENWTYVPKRAAPSSTFMTFFSVVLNLSSFYFVSSKIPIFFFFQSF